MNSYNPKGQKSKACLVLLSFTTLNDLKYLTSSINKDTSVVGMCV